MSTDPMPRNVVIGQPVDPAKVQRAKELRKTMTEAERRLWERLRGNRLDGGGTAGAHFRRQQVIAGFIVDFYCHAAGLVVEVDGEVHVQQAAEDAARDRALGERGFRVLRYRNEQVLEEMEAVLEQIRREMAGPD